MVYGYIWESMNIGIWTLNLWTEWQYVQNTISPCCPVQYTNTHSSVWLEPTGQISSQLSDSFNEDCKKTHHLTILRKQANFCYLLLVQQKQTEKKNWSIVACIRQTVLFLAETSNSTTQSSLLYVLHRVFHQERVRAWNIASKIIYKPNEPNSRWHLKEHHRRGGGNT